MFLINISFIILIFLLAFTILLYHVRLPYWLQQKIALRKLHNHKFSPEQEKDMQDFKNYINSLSSEQLQHIYFNAVSKSSQNLLNQK